MAVVLSVLGALGLKEKIAESAKNMLIDMINPPDHLNENHRWMNITIINKTQFQLLLTDSWFASGRFWQACGNVLPFNHAAFSVCNQDYKRTGSVKGAVKFDIEIPGENIQMVISFDNPFIGSMGLRSDFLDNMESCVQSLNEINEHFDKHDIIIGPREVEIKVSSTENAVDDVKDIEKKMVSIHLHVVCGVGTNSSVTLTQEVE